MWEAKSLSDELSISALVYFTYSGRWTIPPDGGFLLIPARRVKSP